MQIRNFAHARTAVATGRVSPEFLSDLIVIFP